MSQRFFRQAQSDLRIAEVLVRPGAYYKAVECAYQATEKALKGLAWAAGLRATGKHDLVSLLQRIGAVVGEPPESVDGAVKHLEPMWGDVRYPSGSETGLIPADAFGEGDAVGAIGAASEVMAWVDAELRQP